jgi:ABC-2 type transport system ATP-binding protein
MKNPTVTIDQLDVRFGETTAIDDLSLTIPGGRITGLLGRNGAGKTTLMTVLAGYRRGTGGRALIDGEDPFEHPTLMAETVLVRDKVPCADSTSVKDHFELAATFRPYWDQDFADSLLDRFEVDRKKRIGKLSHGQRAAVTVIAGLASRAPLTMFDEPHLGMDAPSRYAFYETLLADYIEHPRTIVLSTHIIDEIANVIEDAVIIDRGRLLTHQPVDELTRRGAEVTGPADHVDDITFGRQVLSTRSLGNTKSAVVFDELDDGFHRRVRSLNVDIGPIPLQDLFVALTESTRHLEDVTT